MIGVDNMLSRSNTMSTIPSALIQSTMTKVKNEMSQLEHWLLSLQESTVVQPLPSADQHTLLYQKLDQLLKELEAQRHTIHHLMDRIEVLESRDDHEIHIDETNEVVDESWFDTSNASPLQNIIIDPTESQYHILKTDDPTVHEVVLDCDISAIVKEEPKEEPKKVEEPKEEPKEVEEPQEEPQEEEEEEAEEDDQELEVLEFKGVTYCKDQDGFVYSVDEEGSPSDQPIGIWKEKTKSVSFYRKA